MSDTTDLLDEDDLDDEAPAREVTVALLHPDASRRALLERKLARSPGIRVTLSSGELDAGVGTVVEELPDVVALFPTDDLVNLVERIDSEAPSVAVLVLDPDEEHFPALAAGAKGTLPSGGSEITKAVLGIARDEAVLTAEWAARLLEATATIDERVRRLSLLTETERDVLEALREGRSAREIADDHEVSERLVNLHVGYAVGKLRRAAEAIRVLDAYERVRDAPPPPSADPEGTADDAEGDDEWEWVEEDTTGEGGEADDAGDTPAGRGEPDPFAE